MFQFLWPNIQWAGSRVLPIIASIGDPYLFILLGILLAVVMVAVFGLRLLLRHESERTKKLDRPIRLRQTESQQKKTTDI